MAKVYADLIRQDLKTVDEVPSALQEEVRQIIVMA
ncbi:CD1375 family protein [Paenibacillus sophorae]|uniref:ASCH domain-containing protein n=1 Tax=Paenibacillus sophorae TaxID=1333845 RepID=A0ABX8HBZ9_9BACL|nr:CD1375 family protein [Paenibacillus sophorae]QWU15634.1 ASCH domain-containing protein [Paenibacillus sophorae]